MITYNEGLVRHLINSVLDTLTSANIAPEKEENRVSLALTALGSGAVLLARRIGIPRDIFLGALGQEWDAMDAFEATGGAVSLAESTPNPDAN